MINQTFYAVKCPECQGKRYLPGRTLCWKCNGDGEIVIPEFVKQPINLRRPILLFAAIIVVGLVLAKVWGLF